MKKTTVVLILNLMALLSFAQVQRQATPKALDSTYHAGETRPGKNNRGARKQMMLDLNLTKEQRGKFKEIRQSNMAKREEINNNDSLTQEQKDARLRELKKQQQQSTMSILNDEQKAKARDIRQAKGKEQ